HLLLPSHSVADDAHGDTADRHQHAPCEACPFRWQKKGPQHTQEMPHAPHDVGPTPPLDRTPSLLDHSLDDVEPFPKQCVHRSTPRPRSAWVENFINKSTFRVKRGVSRSFSLPSGSRRTGGASSIDAQDSDLQPPNARNEALEPHALAEGPYAQDDQ